MDPLRNCENRAMEIVLFFLLNVRCFMVLFVGERQCFANKYVKYKFISHIFVVLNCWYSGCKR